MTLDGRSARQWWGRALAYLETGIWRSDLVLGRWQQRGVVLLRLSSLVGEGFVRDNLLLRASALTYFTVLSMVPLLAIVSAIVTAVGVTENVVGAIVAQIAPVSPEAAQQLQSFVEHANIAGLGTLGAVSLFLTSIFGIGNIELALNQIFGAARARSWSDRLPDYLAVLIVAPLLLGVAISMSATAKSQWIVQKLLEYAWFAQAYDLGLTQAPTLVLGIAFSFLYWFLPNTRVRPLAALVGGALAAVGVNLALGLYVGLSVGAARASALYGSFAQLPLFFVWVYFFWVIALLGAEIAAACQNLETAVRIRHAPPGAPARREELGLRVALEIARAFRDGSGPCTPAGLARGLQASEPRVLQSLSALHGAGMIAPVKDPGAADAFQLGRPAERIPVSALLAAVRGERECEVQDGSPGDAVDALLAELRESERRAAAGATLADLLEPADPTRLELPAR